MFLTMFNSWGNNGREQALMPGSQFHPGNSPGQAVQGIPALGKDALT